VSKNNHNQDMESKQDQLVSGTNIKTINGESILGSGNITISGGGGGAIPEGLEQRLGGIEENIRTLQQGLEGTTNTANSASQTANATARTLSQFTSYAEQNYATKTNTYTKAEVDQKIANAGGGGSYDYERVTEMITLNPPSTDMPCQTLYIKLDSELTDGDKELLGIFVDNYDVWFVKEGSYIVDIGKAGQFNCDLVETGIYSFNLPGAMSGAYITPDTDTSNRAYFVNQVEASKGSIKLTDLRYVS
jgi:hypothetical protein